MTKIATWNVNSLGVRLEHVQAWIKSQKPDVLMLQELKCLEENCPVSVFEDMGYNVAVRGQKTYNGVAILSKWPLEDVTKELPGFADDQARYIEAFTKDLRVICVYAPNGMSPESSKYTYKLEFYAALQKHLNHLFTYDEKLICAGDFNVAPFYADAFSRQPFEDGQILCSLPERESLRAILNLGYTDALRALCPDRRDYFSWWDYRGGAWEQNQGFRIDHLLLSPKAADTLLAGDVDTTPRAWEKPSDHAPVWIALGDAA